MRQRTVQIPLRGALLVSLMTGLTACQSAPTPIPSSASPICERWSEGPIRLVWSEDCEGGETSFNQCDRRVTVEQYLKLDAYIRGFCER